VGRLVSFLLLFVEVTACTQCGAGAPGHPDAGLTGDASVDAGLPRADAGDAEAPDASLLALVPMLTQRGDPGRTGANTAEMCLTPAVAPSLHLIATLHMDGQLYAQPLIVPGVNVGGTLRDLLVAASTANEVSAFDARSLSTTPVWTVGPEVLGTPAQVVRNVSGPLGILSTPVVDPSSNRLYVVARSCPTATALSGCTHTLHVLDMTTGQALDAVTIAASFTDDDGGVHTFDPDTQWNRPGLLLQNGRLYVAWGAGQSGQQHEEDILYWGQIMSFDTTNLHAPPRLLVDTRNTRGGGIWQAGAGVAGDGNAVFVTTGNGILDSPVTSPLNFPPTPIDQENSVVRWDDFADGGTGIANYYDDRPYMSDGNVFQYMETNDIDFSSGGPTIIPESNHLIAGSKAGILYLLDRQTMQQVQPPLSAFHQPPLAAGQSLYIYSWGGGPQVLGSPVVWRRNDAHDDALVFLWPRSDLLTRLEYLPAGSLTVQAASTDVAGGGGGMISLSANGTQDGTAVIWAVLGNDPAQGGEPAQVRAYDARTLTQVWSASAGGYAKFVCPVVSGGRLFVASWDATGCDVLVFGAPECGDP
jgi:hypothetical protein